MPSPLLDDAHVATTGALAGLAALRTLAVSLDSAGLPWLLWKGPALAAAAWDDPTARHFCDLDLVVAPRDRERAASAILGAGWDRRHGMTGAQQRRVLGGTGAFEFERGDGGPLVEMHWRFFASRFPALLRPETVLGRSEYLPVGGFPVRSPSHGDLLLLQAAHAAKHGWSQAEEVATYARLVTRGPGAFEALVSRGPKAPGARAVALAEALLGWFGIGTPARGGGPRREGREHPWLDEAVAACVERMRRGEAAWRPTHSWSLLWTEGRSAHARYWCRALLTPTLEEWKWVRLPDPLSWAYPLVRLTRLASRVGSRTARAR